MIREHFEHKQTITTILADSEKEINAAKDAMISARNDLENYIFSDSFFSMTYEPCVISDDAPLIVKRMADAADEAGCGPMASVAASVAWSGVEAMKKSGASFGLIDNGGDIVLFSDRILRVGIFAGNAESSGKYAFIIPPQKEFLGICTSSATVGPSVSFGIADAVVCFSKNPAKADAWATQLCNKITPENFESEIPQNSEIIGVYAVIGDWIGKRGKLPEIVNADVSYDLITKGV